MSIDRKTGRAFCFACGYRGSVAGGSSRYEPPSNSPNDISVEHIINMSCACDEHLVAEVTLNRRRISPETADQLGLRVITHRGRAFIAFPYFTLPAMPPAYWKLRPANGDKKPMLRIPAGVPSVLYNQTALAGLKNHEAPLIVEGEFDVAALREAGHLGVVSVPDGALSRIHNHLLQPLHRFNKILIGVDNDEAGERLAVRLRTALQPKTCRRIVWQEGV